MSAATKHWLLLEPAPGLWRWTAEHAEWRPGAPPNSPGDWGPEVGSVACELDGAFVVIDALVPADADRFWQWADARAAAAGRVLALSTIAFHRRDRERFVERYGASTSRARETLPDGLEAIALRGAGEVVFWIPDHASLICGDRLLGDGEGGLRLCPPSWLRYLESGLSVEDLRALLRPLLELPVERVLVSHGEPVLRGGREAIARVIR